MDWIHWLEDHLLPCHIRQLTGIDCPGCGMQRAFVALLKGNIQESIQHHPALLPFLALILFLFVHLKFRFRFGPKLIVVLFFLTFSIMFVNFLGNLLFNQ